MNDKEFEDFFKGLENNNNSAQQQPDDDEFVFSSFFIGKILSDIKEFVNREIAVE